MKKFFLITIMVIIAMVFAACNRGSGRTEGSTQQQTASEEQTQTDEEPYLQTLTGDLSAFAEDTAEKNNKIGLFIHTPENPIKIWGWSKDGKVGISQLEDTESRGGTSIRAFVLNAVSDTVLWERKIDTYNFDDGYIDINGDIPENELAAFFSNFQNVCRQQFGIEIQETRPMVPYGSAFRHNGKIYVVIINADSMNENDWITKYTVIVETDEGRKTIASTDTFLTNLPVFYRYNVSPFEERALIILRWDGMSHSYGFIYTGCHLAAGF